MNHLQPDQRPKMPARPRPNRRSPYVTRTLVIGRVESHLRAHASLRLHMTLLVAMTGAFGLLASFSMLRLGLDSMAWRYPLALAASYAFFLLLLWLWLRTQASDYLEAADVPWPGCDPTANPLAGAADFTSGGGGDFAGGGASAPFDAPPAPLDSASKSPFGSVGDAASAIGDADELAAPIIVIVVAAAVAAGFVIAAGYVVYIAPALFAELLVDGALSYALFRHLRSAERPFWLIGVVRRTALPFMVTGVFLAAAGAAMATYVPGARSIGQVFKHKQHDSVAP